MGAGMGGGAERSGDVRAGTCVQARALARGRGRVRVQTCASATSCTLATASVHQAGAPLQQGRLGLPGAVSSVSPRASRTSSTAAAGALTRTSRARSSTSTTLALVRSCLGYGRTGRVQCGKTCGCALPPAPQPPPHTWPAPPPPHCPRQRCGGVPLVAGRRRHHPTAACPPRSGPAWQRRGTGRPGGRHGLGNGSQVPGTLPTPSVSLNSEKYLAPTVQARVGGGGRSGLEWSRVKRAWLRTRMAGHLGLASLRLADNTRRGRKCTHLTQGAANHLWNVFPWPITTTQARPVQGTPPKHGGSRPRVQTKSNLAL
jgi:hypothetical protein